MKRKLPPLIQLFFETVSLRKLLLNRVSIVVLITAVILVAFGGYAAANTGGTIQGTVVDENGDPISDATVTLSEEVRLGTNPTHETTTDGNGEFVFEGMEEVLEFRIQAETDDGHLSEERRIHLYFPGQNHELELVVDRSGES